MQVGWFIWFRFLTLTSKFGVALSCSRTRSNPLPSNQSEWTIGFNPKASTLLDQSSSLFEPSANITGIHGEAVTSKDLPMVKPTSVFGTQYVVRFWSDPC